MPHVLKLGLLMTKRQELTQLFKRLASEVAERDLGELNEDAAITDLGLDSLAMLELVGNMERELKIRIPDEDLVGIQTVRQLVERVEKRLG